MNPINVASTGLHLAKLLYNPDDNIKSLIYLGDKITNAKTSATSANVLFTKVPLEEMYDQQIGLEQIHLADLKKLEEDTFGKEVYHFYTENGLDMYPIQYTGDISPATYISERTRKLHDFLHVLLGYGTDLIGEAKVNAFVANQIRMPMSFLIMAGIIIKFFFTKPAEFNQLIEGITDGWSQGNKHKNFLLQNWDEMLYWTTEEVKNYCRSIN